MSSQALVFPASKTKEIATADPDVKEISKQSIELLRAAAQYFANSLFAKCFEEARRRKRQTADIRDFIAAVTNDDCLSAMLGQFLEKDARPPESSGSDADDASDAEGDADAADEEEEPPKKTLEEILQENGEEDESDA